MKKYRTTAAVFRQFMEDEYRFTGTRFTTSDIVYQVRKRRSTSELADRLCRLVNMEEYIRGRVRAMLKSGHLQVVPDGKTRHRRYILTDDHWFGGDNEAS